MCPQHSIKGQYDEKGIPTYTMDDLKLPGYCPTNFVGVEKDPETNGTTIVYNDQGPVYGPNGQVELDPENSLCPKLVNIHLNICFPDTSFQVNNGNNLFGGPICVDEFDSCYNKTWKICQQPYGREDEYFRRPAFRSTGSGKSFINRGLGKG